MYASPSTRVSKCTFAIRAARGNARPTRTATACYGNTSPRAPIWRAHAEASGSHRHRTERSPSTNARLEDTIGSVRPSCCDDRVKAPLGDAGGALENNRDADEVWGGSPSGTWRYGTGCESAGEGLMFART